jgi:CheY-like chemotaxis protein
MSNDASQRKECRVVLIEDDPDDVYLFRRALEEVHLAPPIEVALEHVDNGLDALFFVSHRDLIGRLPDVFVLDLNMPRLDGVKFLKTTRESFHLRDIPVVVLTTSAEGAVHAAAMRAGADKVFVKPDNAPALEAIAREIVERGVAYASGAR